MDVGGKTAIRYRTFMPSPQPDAFTGSLALPSIAVGLGIIFSLSVTGGIGGVIAVINTFSIADVFSDGLKVIGTPSRMRWCLIIGTLTGAAAGSASGLLLAFDDKFNGLFSQEKTQ